MPASKRKRPQDWTTEEAVRKVFPKRVVDALEEVVRDDPADVLPERRSDKRPSTKKGR